jgi:uncharacterized membrane protein
MDFGFLASIVRGQTFPPQNMWMAGLPIGYSYYFGHVVMGILTKLLGLVPAVTYNLALITLFAAIFSGAFGLALGLTGRLKSGWIAGLLCALAGNPAGMKQYFSVFHQCLVDKSLSPFIGHVYDFFGPSRVIPGSYNEFPYFSVVYGDMHPHTLAQPFGLLFIGTIAALFAAKPLEPFFFNRKSALTAGGLCLSGAFLFLAPGGIGVALSLASLVLLFGVLRPSHLSWALLFGFLTGGMVFLNTWEAPLWLGFVALVLLVRGLSPLKARLLVRGFALCLSVFTAVFILLGWWAVAQGALDPLYLGGRFLYFEGACGIGVVLCLLGLWVRPLTRPMARQFFSTFLFLLAVAVAARALWAPFFSGFIPQESQLIWVLPKIRTTLSEFLSIYGLFVSVILLSFTVLYAGKIQGWIGRKLRVPRNLDGLAEALTDRARTLTAPSGPVTGMLAIGLVSLALVWGASWVHWTEPPEKTWFSLLFASAAGLGLAAAVFLRDRWEPWLAVSAFTFLWIGTLAVHGIQLSADIPVTLRLSLFSCLWILAFFHLGMGIEAQKNRPLAFAYLLVALFMGLLAGIEVFAVKEYLGGDLMRTNTVFKFGIVAWEVASVATGIFLPKLLSFFRELTANPRKESPHFQRAMFCAAGLTLFALMRILTGEFLEDPVPLLVAILDVIFAGTAGFWLLQRKGALRWAGFLVLALFLPFLAAPFSQSQEYGTLWGVLHAWGEALAGEFIFPLALVSALLYVGTIVLEGARNVGRRLAYAGWACLGAFLVLMVSVYPLAASARKGHWFWRDFPQRPTLNGLAYLSRETPYDAAAIRFINEHVPGQPCLVEFVGAGYNTWGSRYSIFTGVPDLMGWNGHVSEWVGDILGPDIDKRYQATDLIYNTTDPVLAKKYLDAYGVRLVVVGPVEREGAGGKPGYPAAGLSKFASFLPLIYRNPQVEIYYNPPAPS